MEDFGQALQEVQPAFGATLASLESYRLHGMLDYGPRYGHLLSSSRTLVEQVRTGENTPLISVLLEGPAGAGKTAMAASLAIESGFPFVKVRASAWGGMLRFRSAAPPLRRSAAPPSAAPPLRRPPLRRSAVRRSAAPPCCAFNNRSAAVNASHAAASAA